MTSKISKYKNKIKALKKKLYHKKLMINSLLDSLERKKIKRKKRTKKKVKKINDIVQKDEFVSNDTSCFAVQTDVTTQDVFDEQETPSKSEEQNTHFILRNNKNENNAEQIFKPNFKFEEYTTYLSSIFVPYIFDDQVTYNLTKVHSIYIKSNIKGIIKYVFKDINAQPIEKSWEILYNVGCVENYSVICVIIHDLFLFVDDFDRVFFLSYALLQGKKLEADILSSTIKMLLSYQALIMKKNGIYTEYVTKIQDELFLFDSFDISRQCNTILNDIDIYANNIAALRIICSFMDWDWTYNTFVCEMLFPRFTETRSQTCVCYLGAICMLGYKNFGSHESTQSILDELKKVVTGDNLHLSIIACTFVKSLDFDFVRKWIKDSKKGSLVRKYSKQIFSINSF